MSGALAVLANSNIFSVIATPDVVSGTGSAGVPFSTNAATATVYGGVGPFTYVWSRRAGPGGTPTNPNGPLTQFTITMGAGQIVNSTFGCVVTDTATGLSVSSNDVGAQFQTF